MLLNPFLPLTLLKINSLKATIFFLFVLLMKSNLLRVKGGLIGTLFASLLILGILSSTSLALGSLFYAYRVKTKFSNYEKSGQDLETVDLY